MTVDASVRTTFEDLRQTIRECLGKEAGIDTSDLHLQSLMDSMNAYRSVDGEWQRFALGDPSRAYTRNLVDECNGNANLLVLVWNPGKASPVHCHSNAHCLMKILSGSLQETQYDWPAGARPMTPRPATKEDLVRKRVTITGQAGDAEMDDSEQMRTTKVTMLHRDDVTYISDAIGLHRISNPSESEVAISLHLYTPPWAAKYGCQIFTEATGQSHRTTQCGFYSIDGVRCE